MSRQDELEKVALERDQALAVIQEAKAANKELADQLALEVQTRDRLLNELSAFQAAAREQAEKLKAACPPPESGFSLNAQFSTGKVITGGQITFRTPDAHDWRQAFDEFEALAKERGWNFAPAPQAAPPPVENKALAIAREEGASPAVVAQVKQATEGVPPPPNGQAWQVLDCERWEVKSEAAGKASVLFYEKASHKGPSVKAVGWTLERAAGLLKHITDTDKIFVTVGEVTAVVPTEGAACRVYYLPGKEYVKTMGPNAGQKDRYKDVYHVRPL